MIAGQGEAAGSVGYVTSSGTTTLDADIGRWDTPYPYPDTGEYAPGLQPTGASVYYIDVDVNDGGQAVFSYLMQTYDAGIYDWYDILMQTPDGDVQLVTKLGKPGSAYGTYWTSPQISLSQPLDAWRDQRVRFIFRIEQDGWGDQTQGQVRQFSLSTCPIAPLAEITDPDALAFENGNRVNVAGLQPAALAGLNCMTAEVARLGGVMTVNSAYRPVAYQTHLREVWDRWNLLRNNSAPACRTLKDEVRREFADHELLLSQRPAAGNPRAPHALGIAIDASIGGLPQGHTVDTVAATCAMVRPWPVRDPPHYQPR